MIKTTQEAAQTEYFGRALVALGEQYKDLVVLDPDVHSSTKTQYFSEKYPDRFIEIGISEQDMIGIAAGLAASGKIPVASGFATFVIGRTWEQVANSVARPALNVKIVGTHAGLSASSDGGSHQPIGDVALMRVLPNIKVVVPADGPEAGEAITALVKDRGPSYLRLNRGSTPVVYDGGCDFRLGEVKTLRDGSDAAIIANGIMVSMALQAAELLAVDNVDARVINLHTVKPLDGRAVEKTARETGAIVTAEEHSIIGGLGGAVAEILAESRPTPVRRVGVMDHFGASSRSYSDLLVRVGLTPEAIVDAVQDVMKRRN